MPRVEEVESDSESSSPTDGEPNGHPDVALRNLTEETWEEIFMKLSTRDIASMSRTNKFFYKLAKSKGLWYNLCARDFPKFFKEQLSDKRNAVSLLSTQSVYKSLYLANKKMPSKEFLADIEKIILTPEQASPWSTLYFLFKHVLHSGILILPLAGFKLGLRMALASAIQILPTVLMVKSLHLWTPNSPLIVGLYTGSFSLLGFFEGLSPFLFLTEERRKLAQPDRFIDRLAKLVRLCVLIGGFVGAGYLLYHMPGAWRSLSTGDRWLLGTYVAVPLSLSLLGTPFEIASAGTTVINSSIAVLRIYGSA